MNRLFLVGFLAATLGLGSPAFALDYTIIAPAARGGGWDQTARSLQKALRASGISRTVRVINERGAGGINGLRKFALLAEGNPKALLVSGYVMVGAIVANKSAITLSDVTPIARLTGEPVAIVVQANSPIQSIADIVAKLKEDVKSISWIGGSEGGVDHITAGLITKYAGAPASKIRYTGFSGGGEAISAIFEDPNAVALSGYGEFRNEINAGRLRLLAVSGDTRLEGVDAPTLKEAGVDLAIENWRMVAAPPGLSPEDETQVKSDIERLVASPAWQNELKENSWIDTYLHGEEFERQLAISIQDTEAVLKDLGIVRE
ncbi:Bug family tripartite tricarboxylate transporter substrate binding protein [Pseudochelatococcus sp. B33]